MQLEKNAYEDDFPIDVNVMAVTEYPFHYHKDIEIIYVLKGEINFRNGPFDYVLRAGDVFTNNMCEVHSISADRENIAASVKISNLFFTRFFPKLTKSTFMFYSTKESNSQQEHLKYMLLNLIYTYLKEGYNYKEQCIEQTLSIIKYLNKNFNVFGFDKKGLTKFESDNPIIIKRMHDIIHYMYDYHAYNITLKDLADMEHLSTFYISHLVKQFTGVSFREFLYFIRVEWSEVYLLDTKRKINTIAKSVGFSTTSYYEKYFKKWFGYSPEEYRAEFAPKIKSQYHPERITILQVNEAIKIIKSCLLAATDHNQNARSVESLRLDLAVTSKAETITRLDHSLEILITLEDHRVLGLRLYEFLNRFNCRRVLILKLRNDSFQDIVSLEEKLLGYDYTVTVSNAFDREIQTYGFDSIAAAFYIFNKHLLSKDHYSQIQLRDQGNENTILKGHFSLFTSCGIPKSSYYAFRLLEKVKGDLILWGPYYAIVKLPGKSVSYVILAYNHNDTVMRLCQSRSTPYEVNSIINDFNDELDIHVSLELPSGKYFVSKYTLNNYNNIFNFMSKLNFPEELRLAHNALLEISTMPQIDVFTDNITDHLNVNLTFRGVGIQTILVQRID